MYIEKYKLTNKEINELHNYWKFINIFSEILNKSKNSIYSFSFGAYEYREYIIPKINQLYTPEKFYFYEKILNKLLWNLLDHINFHIKDIKICEESKLFKTCDKLKNELSIGRSFSHKIHILDNKEKIDYIFSHYQSINKINIINKIFIIMRSKELYDKVMLNKKNFYKVKVKKEDIYYYPYDYPFPNVNLLFYNMNNKKIWIDRIKKLYYNKNNSGWYDFGCK
jgi:hypothetical protein